jgi:hypothetical protein
MSVICFETEKFERIAQTLKMMSGNSDDQYILMELLPNEMTRREKHEFVKRPDAVHLLAVQFANDLHRSNVSAYNRAYDECQPVESISAKGLPLSKIQLCKSLHSVRYNMIENDGTEHSFRGVMDRLNRMMNALHEHIVVRLPEYDKAAWS